MSIWGDAAAKVTQLAADFILLRDRFDELKKLVEKQGTLISDLREENSKLTTRVAVLEEGRKTIDAQVEASLTRTVSKWRLDALEAENERLKRGQLPPEPPKAE